MVDADLRGEVAAHVAGLVADPPQRHHVLLPVEGQLVVLAAVEVDRELRDAQDRRSVVEEPRLDAVGRAHRDPAGEPEVAVEPGVEDEAAVGLHREHLPAGLDVVGVAA